MNICPNAAGKSTLAAKYLRARIPIVNPDVIALALGPHDSGQAAVLLSGKIALQERLALMVSGQSVAIETRLPAEDIVRRFARSMENLPVVMGIAARSMMVDNTGRGFRLVLIREDDRTRIVARKIPAWVMRVVPD